MTSQELHEIHVGLLRQLKLATEACVPGSGVPRLSDVFLAWRERLLLYGDYCSNLTHAQDTLKTLEQRDSTVTKQLAVSGNGETSSTNKRDHLSNDEDSWQVILDELPSYPSPKLALS